MKKLVNYLTDPNPNLGDLYLGLTMAVICVLTVIVTLA